MTNITFVFSLLLILGAAHDTSFVQYPDYLPDRKQEAMLKSGKNPLYFKTETTDEMLVRRETESYKEFLNGRFVATVHTMLRPLVKEEVTFAPWLDNLVIYTIRENLKPVCYWWGWYYLIFTSKVQIFYDCVTWMDMDFLAYQTQWCIMFMCPLPKQLW